MGDILLLINMAILFCIQSVKDDRRYMALIVILELALTYLISKIASSSIELYCSWIILYFGASIGLKAFKIDSYKFLSGLYLFLGCYHIAILIEKPLIEFTSITTDWLYIGLFPLHVICNIIILFTVLLGGAQGGKRLRHSLSSFSIRFAGIFHIAFNTKTKKPQ